MLAETASEFMEHQHSRKKGVSCACCGDTHEQDESWRLMRAMFGGILVLNSYIAKALLSDFIDPFAIELSAITGALVLGYPILNAAIKDLIRGKMFMNELVALALVAAFAHRDYRTAGAVAFFMLISTTIERRTAIGAEASIEALIRLTPRRARRLSDQGEEEVDALSLSVGDVCRVRPGENFPADGSIVTGTTSVNQASITGESLPVDKEQEAEVYAGTQNLTGLVDVRVTRVGTDTTLGKVKDLIVAAEKSKLPIMRMIDRYVGFYTPTILMIAALVWFFTRDLNRVIAVLVMSCPCALVIATPSAVIAAIAAASRLGILIKDVAQIELAAKVRAIVFDKTGTLTEGDLEVARLQPAPDVELSELLQVATSTESQSNHPAANAMRRLAQEANIEVDDPDTYKEVPGKGVEATFAGVVCRVGRETWLKECGLETVGMAESLNQPENAAASIIFVAKGDKILGWIGLRDAIRKGAGDAVAQIRDLGIVRCAMFTGDNEAVANMVAARVGLTEVRAGCLPQEKVNFVEELKAEGGFVAVVGDGVNDAPALAAGDIGIAMGAIGSDVAVQSASIALMNNDLRRIPFLIWLSRRSRMLINENLLLGLGFIVIGLYFSTIGKLSPVFAAVMHSAGTLLIIFNSARLVRAGEHLESTAES